MPVAVWAVVELAGWVGECLRLPLGAVVALDCVALVRLRSVGRIASRR